MNNYKMDGWKESDWEGILLYSKVLLNTALNIDSGVGSGGGSFSPTELLELVGHLEIEAARLRELASNYY